MKAYIKNEHEKKGRFNGHKYRLTVSMIVKNEEKNIRRCLDALKPLLDAVPSELIITDTGSTDNTVEIIKEYTDNVLFFSFCGDMAAARNVGLRAAQGEWYMSIDADEWFEDITDIVHFFNSGDCDKYGCASYSIRNYYDLDGKEYAKQDISRLARIYDDLHYEGRMHETLINRRNPYKQLSSYVHHYGYAFVNNEERILKFNRNVTGLKQEIAEHPDELRFVYQIIKEYAAIKDFKAAIDWCQIGLIAEKEYPNSIRRLQIKVQLMSVYFFMEQYQKVIDIGDEIFASEKKIEVFHTDACELQMFSYMRLNQREKAIQAGLIYLDIYKKYKDGELDESALLLGISDGVMPWVYAQVCHNLAKCYAELDEYSDAALYFDKINMLDIDSVAYATVLLGIKIADKSNQYERILELYHRIEQTGDKIKQQNLIEITELYCKENSSARTEIARALAQNESNDGYIMLNKLRLADQLNHNEEAVQLIDWFVNHFEDWSPIYADVLYIAMKQDYDTMPFIDLFDTEDLQLYTTQIISNHFDFATVTMHYFSKHSYNDSLKGLYWSICLRERAVLFSVGVNLEQYIGFFQSYAKDLAVYAHSIYKTELFSEENNSVLPRVYRFGHYMQLAFSAKDKEDEVEYMKNLKIALHHYPIMQEPIKVLSEYFEEQHEAQDNEFAQLANQVKSQIEQYLLQGQYDQAEAVLAELAELLPNDEDVKRYRLQIQAAQSAKKIGTNIPQ